MRPPPPTPKHDVCRVLRDHEFYCIKMTGEEAVRSPPPAFPCPFGSADVDNMAAQPRDITEGDAVRFYAEVPKMAATTEEWLAGNPVAAQRNAKADEDKQTH